MSSEPPVRYRTDAQGRIVEVDEPFRAFARRNGAAALSDTVIGSILLDPFSGAPVVALYRAVLARLAGGTKTVRFDYRCDASHLRRRMRMTIEPRADGGFDFLSETLDVTPRPSVPLELVVGSTAPPARDDALIRACAWCRRVAIENDEWIEVEDALTHRGLLDRIDLPHVTHAVCPRCEVGLLSA